MINSSPSHRSLAFYQAMPKVDLHRHLEGSLRLGTLVEVAQRYGLDVPGEGQLGSLVQISRTEPHTFQNFLSKFETLRLFYRTPEIIQRITREAITDAAADNVRYLELRFTPVALCRAQGFTLVEVIDWVIEGLRQARSVNGPLTRLIVSVNRHEPPAVAEKAIQAAVDRIDQGVAGIDVAGNEAAHPDLGAFHRMLNEASQAGLGLTIHGGEWGGAQNVVDAIVAHNADRIGHGVRVMEDPQAVELAYQAGIPFEVCLTSNVQSGVVADFASHPLPRMLSAGLNVALGTDDPSISQITLSHEYQLACEELRLPTTKLRQCLLRAAQAAFLPESERVALAQRVVGEFDSLAGSQGSKPA